MFAPAFVNGELVGWMAIRAHHMALLFVNVRSQAELLFQELWRINVGTGFNAPPMTYAVNGRQYIAIASGLWRNAKNKLARVPELRNLSNATMIFVFGL